MILHTLYERSYQTTCIRGYTYVWGMAVEVTLKAHSNCFFHLNIYLRRRKSTVRALLYINNNLHQWPTLWKARFPFSDRNLTFSSPSSYHSL